MSKSCRMTNSKGLLRECPDIPAYGEGDAEQAAIEDLKEAPAGYVETIGLDNALGHLSQPTLKTIDVELGELAGG